MPDKAGADADASGFRIAEEKVSCRVAGEVDAGAAAAEEDISILTGVAGVAGIDAIAPHLETGLEDMLAAGERHTVIKLDNGVGEVLLYDLAANIGQSRAAVGLGRETAAETDQQQAGAAG